jgi:hypothetical protein
MENKELEKEEHTGVGSKEVNKKTTEETEMQKEK